MSIRVVVVDDQALVRGGFALILNHQESIEVVAEAGNGLEAIEAVRAHRPDMVLMDIRMPEMDGLEAVFTVASGGALLSPSITRRLIGQFADRLVTDTRLAAHLQRLTDREKEILGAVARGLNNAEISDSLFIGAATVKSHVSSTLAKLELRDRAQAVVFAYESGFVGAQSQK